MNNREIGASHEEIALKYLLEKGYFLIKKNFRFGKLGEIDLVMKHKNVFVFVEVKARFSDKYGRPEEAVTTAKRKQIRRIAEGFVQIMGLDDFEGRFDVVAIDYFNTKADNPNIVHLVDAF